MVCDRRLCCIRQARAKQDRIQKPPLSAFGYGGPATGPNPTSISSLSHKKRRAALVRAHRKGGWTQKQLLDRLRMIHYIRRIRAVKARIMVDIKFIIANPKLFREKTRA